MSLIGSNNPKHITKFWIWQKWGFCPPRTKLNMRMLILNGLIQPEAFYSNNYLEKINAEVAEPGQMRKLL